MSIFQQEPSKETCAAVLALPTTTVDIRGIQAEVPCLLTDCFDYIHNHGLVKGIFRVSGSVRRTRDVTSNYASYSSWLSREDAKPTPHDAAALIKRFTRDYFFAINRLFSPSVVAQLHSSYLSGGKMNYDAVQNRSMSFSSGLSSVEEEDQGSQDSTNHEGSNSEVLASAVARILASKSTTKRSGLLFFYLSRLSTISAHNEDTQMSASNLAILFQPYLFETSNIAELKSLQALLEFLLENFSLVAEKYAPLVEDCTDSDGDHGRRSLELRESPAVSPLTDCSSDHEIPHSVWKDRRRSWSSAMSSLWTAYKSPVFYKSPMSAKSEKNMDYFSAKTVLSPRPMSTVCPNELTEEHEPEYTEQTFIEQTFTEQTFTELKPAASPNMLSMSYPAESDSVLSKSISAGKKPKRWSFMLPNNSSQSLLSSVFDKTTSQVSSPTKTSRAGESEYFRTSHDEDRKLDQPAKAKRRFSLRLKRH